MRNIWTTALLILAVSMTSAQAQQRVKKKTPEDFAGIYKVLGEAWEAGAYGKANKSVRDLLALISIKRTETILSAMPSAPEGYEVVPQRKKKSASHNPLAGMAAAMGTVISQKYRPAAGGRNLEVSVTADSPMAQMFKMWMTNPAMLGADAELIKYNQYDAVLKKQGKGWNLQVLIGKDVVEIKVPNENDDFTLGWINQGAVDALAMALGT
ncbi:MAG: hypothetical protein AAF493_22990 [Pseudomonadota bacterium]